MRIKVTKPKAGDIKYRTKFILFPRKINDEWVWLERVKLRYKYNPPCWADNGYWYIDEIVKEEL